MPAFVGGRVLLVCVRVRACARVYVPACMSVRVYVFECHSLYIFVIPMTFISIPFRCLLSEGIIAVKRDW